MSIAGTSNSYRRFAQNPASEDDMAMHDYLSNYYANAHEAGEFFAALGARASAAIIGLEATPEECVALASYLTEETLQVARFGKQQCRTQAALQSIHARISEKLDRFNAKKKASAAFFTLAAAASAAWAAFTAGLDHKRLAAAAAAVSILLAAVGKGIDSVMKRKERGMKKQREVMRCMVVGGGLIVRNLTEIYALAREMKSEAEAVPEAGDEREKAAAMKESLQELQRRAIQGGLNANSARQAAFSLFALVDLDLYMLQIEMC